VKYEYLATHEVVADLQYKKEDFERFFLVYTWRRPLLNGSAGLAQHCMDVGKLLLHQQYLAAQSPQPHDRQTDIITTNR